MAGHRREPPEIRLDRNGHGIPLATHPRINESTALSGDIAMQVELYCPHCCCSFAADPDTPHAEVLDRMAEEGPWYALGDGETYEDMIFAALLDCGAIRCTECGEPVSVTEQSLGQLTMEVLGS